MGIPLRVLLVEDSPDDALLVLQELRRGGYDPLFERVDSRAAMEAILDRHPWDLVLGDYNMPHFSGTAALQVLREHGVDAPFLFVSGSIGEDVAVAAMKAGAQDYVMKSNLKRLVPAIQRELHDAEVRRERKRAQDALLERARLAELSADVSVALAQGTTVGDILQRGAGAIIRHVDAALARIWTWNPSAGMLELAASAGADAPAEGDPLRPGEPGLGAIASERRAYLTNTAAGDPQVPDREWVQRRGIQAFAAYPLIVQDRLVGVMAVFASHALSDFATKALATVADALAAGVERKHAEEALRLSETTYRSLVDDSPYGIFHSTPEGRLLAVNPALVEMLGYDSAGELLAVNVAALFADPGARERLVNEVLRAERFHAESQWRRRDGRALTVRETGRVVRDPQGHVDHFTVIVEDVTERQLLESQLRQAQKMEAIGRLAGGVAHDFNNLLTAILGFAELLLETLPADHPAREDGQEIQRAAHRAADLTRHLLAFSRQQVLAPTVVSLNDVIAGTEKMLKRVIGEDVDFRTVLAADLGHVRADPGQLEQVVLNLVVNARDAMPRGGQLTIETANVDLDGEYAREHSEVTAGPHVMVAVSDTGTGMDAETQARIFEPFFTTKPKGQGTGLGLATVYGIVRQSGGHVWVYSELGHGTAFKIYLPRVADATEAPRVPEPGTALGGTETILVVEDQEEVRVLMRRVLEGRGYTVLAATGGAEALTRAGGHSGPVHLLVTDVIMPGMSGREVATALIQARPALRTLYLSGYADESIVRHGILQPGVAFLQKPFTAEGLARKVREILDAGSE